MSTPKPEQKCLVFDFDGTLADTMDKAMLIYNEMAMRHGFLPVKQEELPATRRMTANEFIKAYRVPRLKIPKLLLEGKRILGTQIETIRPFPGLEQVLPRLRPHFELLGILTSNSKENVTAFLNHNNLNLFDFVSTVPKLKGKRKHLAAIAATYSLEPAEIVFVGDERRDVRAGKKALVNTVAVSWGFNARDALIADKPDYVFDEVSDLENLIKLREAL